MLTQLVARAREINFMTTGNGVDLIKKERELAYIGVEISREVRKLSFEERAVPAPRFFAEVERWLHSDRSGTAERLLARREEVTCWMVAFAEIPRANYQTGSNDWDRLMSSFVGTRSRPEGDLGFIKMVLSNVLDEMGGLKDLHTRCC